MIYDDSINDETTEVLMPDIIGMETRANDRLVEYISSVIDGRYPELLRINYMMVGTKHAIALVRTEKG